MLLALTNAARVLADLEWIRDCGLSSIACKARDLDLIWVQVIHAPVDKPLQWRFDEPPSLHELTYKWRSSSGLQVNAVEDSTAHLDKYNSSHSFNRHEFLQVRTLAHVDANTSTPLTQKVINAIAVWV